MKMLFWHLDSGPAQSRCRHHGSGRYQGKVKSSPNPFSGFKTWLLRVERYAGFLKQLPFPLQLSSIIMAILPQLLNIHLFWNDASLYPMHGAWEDHIVAFKVYPVTQMDKHWHYTQPSKVSSIIKLLVSMFLPVLLKDNSPSAKSNGIIWDLQDSSWDVDGFPLPFFVRGIHIIVRDNFWGVYCSPS